MKVLLPQLAAGRTPMAA